tara:strand:+ start:7153 stop:7728 length:576 start_codon:yes stop_codon:yes gene_type:complete
MGGVNQVFFPNEFMAKFPNFHPRIFFIFLGLFIPVSLWGIPKGIDALVLIENDIFPEKAFCVSGSTCTSEEHQNVIRWWTQIVMGLLLMMWNRMSSHRIRDIIVHLTPRISTQACRDLPTYRGNVINLTVQKGINSIMSAGLIAFFIMAKYWMPELLDWIRRKAMRRFCSMILVFLRMHCRFFIWRYRTSI